MSLPPSPTSPTFANMVPGHFMNRRLLPMVTHHCQACGGETSLPYRASVFSELQYCNHCGAASVGAAIRTAQELQLATAAMAQQDELSGLFARTMTFSNPTPPPEEPKRQIQPEHFQPTSLQLQPAFEQSPPPQLQPAFEQSPPPQLQPAFEQPAPPQLQPAFVEEKRAKTPVYASMHYIPPTAFHTQATPQPSPEPEIRILSDNEIADILIRHNIDPHSLFPSQVSLFRNAGDEQRTRLLELWRIAPPNLGAYDIAKEQATWLETTLAREEEVAQLRYERAVMEAQGIGSPHNEGIVDNGNGFERVSRPASAPAAPAAEPYMMSGYEMLAQREYERSPGAYQQATDPVYNSPMASGGGGWKQGLMEMENNYGAYAAQREGGTSMGGMDEEMVM